MLVFINFQNEKLHISRSVDSVDVQYTILIRHHLKSIHRNRTILRGKKKHFPIRILKLEMEQSDINFQEETYK